MANVDPGSISALTFDVFGTVVDWRTSIIREGELLAQAKGFQIDWPRFADAWRAGYQPAMDRVRSGALPWTILDDLHRMILDDLLVQFEIAGLSAQEISHLNQAWHRLIPWPDALPGLHQLRARYILATLSNGNMSLLVNMAKHAALPWDCILSADLFCQYKPHPDVYLGAARLLGIAPEQVLMVAAHPGDLQAARQAGLKTAYVPRPLEHGATDQTEVESSSNFDIIATDFLDLAAKLIA
jgi:2-haloacid dehalogenase